MASNSPIEKSITNGILKWLKKQPETFAWKEFGGPMGTAGIPDIICCHKGKFVGIEVKKPGGKPSKLQLQQIEKINLACGHAFIACSLDEVKEQFKKIEKESH